MSGKAPKEVNLVETESRWFKVLVVVVAAVSIVLFAYYTWTYNKLRTSTNSPISSSEATTLMWLSIVMLVLASIVFIWGIWRLFVAKGYREYLVSSTGKKVSSAGQAVTEFVTTTEGGFAPTDYAAVVVPARTAATVTPKPVLRPAQVPVAAAPRNVQYALGTTRAAPAQPTAGRVAPRPAGVPVGAARAAPVAPRPAQVQVLQPLQAQTSSRLPSSSRLPGQLPSSSSSRLPPTYVQPAAPGVVPLVRSQVQINPR